MKLSRLLLTLPMAILLSSCDFGVLPVGYIRYYGESSEYVTYSSDMYGIMEAHITVWKDKEESEKDFASPWIEFRFNKSAGVDTINEVPYLLADISGNYYSLDVTVTKKDNPLYGEDKAIYLNGEPILLDSNSHNSVNDYENIISFHFEDYGIIRTNPDGKIDETKVNVLEYK